jgi:hypothetical protein
VIEKVDWKCDVLTRYSDVNLGCGAGPATGISWVFEQVEEAIILEDDCVPHPTFFRFCSELLERYRDDSRVMQVCGNNYQFGRAIGPDSYVFSHHNICWGWASWRRAWASFDMTLALWPELRDTGWLRSIAEYPTAVAYWQRVFDEAHARDGHVDYWDYQWTFACWAQSGLSILPSVPLIENIGFGAHATHTLSPRDHRASIRAEAMTFPLKHPRHLARDADSDQVILEAIAPRIPVPATPSWRRSLLPRIAAALRRRAGFGQPAR